MRRQPFILLSFSSSKKLRKAQETQSYQRIQCIGHTDSNTSGANGPRGETGAFPPSSTAGLCAACEIALSAAFVTLIPPRFYIHTFPGSLRTLTISNSSISDHLSSQFSTSLTNGPRLLSQAKVGTHSASPTGSHTAAYTPKQGRFGWGRYYYPRSISHVSETLRGQVSERQTLPLLGLGLVCSRRTQKACGTAMCLCASLSRGVAAPLGCVIFSVSGEIYGFTPRTQGVLCVRGGGGITTPGVRCVLPKFSAPACQSSLFAVF